MDLNYHLKCLDARESLRTMLPRAYEYTIDTRVHESTHFKLIELWCELLRERPRTILEIGCGATTCVFAMYAKEYGATVHSTEDKEEYLTKCRNKLGDLNEFVSIKHVPLYSESEISHFPPGATYTINGKAPDWLYIDGPACKPDQVCADAQNLVAGGTLPKTILFDFRFTSVVDFVDRFNDLYSVDIGCAASKLEWFHQHYHHSVMRRR